ncbi:HAD family phosphatase [Ottowia sp. SB7-C50]|uniref:HAD family hydrolase n=1 Tax=Ottowia sp. SB7-C50 TaxID=3081231 RepID=UPI0029554B3C|nr:HAD family phosphatase [Ottowia sp. SB7-C50]WOP15448.1 HAD family phosphatase [Ottowia sp. SB7-C50]
MFEAILFDCDGVLVDSEPITHGVLRDMLAESGWDMPIAECMRHFIGRTVRSQSALIEARTGQPLTDAWMAAFYARRDAQLRARLQPISGAIEAVRAAHGVTRGRIACASGADRGKLILQLGQTGLAEWFGPHVFSGHELPRSKPYPDVYLAAAASLSVLPARSLVIEDTPTGVAAGKGAGATVWAYCPAAHLADDLRAAGADLLFPSMAELPARWRQVGLGAA